MDHTGLPTNRDQSRLDSFKALMLWKLKIFTALRYSSNSSMLYTYIIIMAFRHICIHNGTSLIGSKPSPAYTDLENGNAYRVMFINTSVNTCNNYLHLLIISPPLPRKMETLVCVHACVYKYFRVYTCTYMTTYMYVWIEKIHTCILTITIKSIDDFLIVHYLVILIFNIIPNSSKVRHMYKCMTCMYMCVRDCEYMCVWVVEYSVYMCVRIQCVVCSCVFELLSTVCTCT